MNSTLPLALKKMREISPSELRGTYLLIRAEADLIFGMNDQDTTPESDSPDEDRARPIGGANGNGEIHPCSDAVPAER